jgi:hypothetical protein
MYDKQRIWSGATDNGGFIAAAIYRFTGELRERNPFRTGISSSSLHANFATKKQNVSMPVFGVRTTPDFSVRAIGFVNGY